MTDPLEELRVEAHGRRAEDQFDVDGGLERLREHTSGIRPGEASHRRRVARVGAFSVAGVGAVAAAGLVIGGGFPPGGDPVENKAVAPVVAEPQGASAPTASVPSAKPAAKGANAQAIAYVKSARESFDRSDLTKLVLTTEESSWVKHPGEKKSLDDTTRSIDAGDGHATRWTDAAPSADNTISPIHRGTEELEVAIPGAADGRMTYWWIDPVVGVYTEFVHAVPSGAGKAVGSVPQQIIEDIKQLSGVLGAAQQIAKADGVRSSAPTATTIGGRSATCIDMSGTGDQTIIPDGPGIPADAGVQFGWTWHVCFDSATELPLLTSYTNYYQVDGVKGHSRANDTKKYTWLPRGKASEALFAPNVDGLRKVGYDTYVRLTK